MIPFMGTQSAVLGYDFGLSYEAGKRMIKSMDNEDFNKFIRDGNTIEFEGKQQNLLSVFSKKHYRNMVQEFTSRIPSSLALQDTIIEASVAIELKKANRTPSAMVEIIQAFASAGGEVIVDKLDRAGELERNFIMTTVPILGLIYAMTKYGSGEPFTNIGIKEPEPPAPLEGGLEHTQIIGHELHPFHIADQPDATEGTTITDPTKEPEPSNSTTIVYTYTSSTGALQTVTMIATEAEHKQNILDLEAQMNHLLELGATGSAQRDAKKLFAYRTKFKEIYGYWA